MNVHMAAPTVGKLTSMHFYAWKKGLKTGMYYLRTRPKADAIQFTVDQAKLKAANEKPTDATAPSTPPRVPTGGLATPTKQPGNALPEQDEEEVCLSCGA